MKLYLLSQDTNIDYNTYDSAVVAARNEDEARNTKVASPGYEKWEWVTPDKVKIKLIGTAVKGTEPGIIVFSFNSG